MAPPDARPIAGVRRDAWALGLPIAVFAMSYGVLATAAGLTVAQACAMSLLVFTGASQFAAVGVLAAGGSLASAFGSAWLLAARNAAYGVALAPVFAGRPRWRRLLAAHWVIDESTAMATAQPPGRAREAAFFATGLAVFVCWNLGTLVGALAGDAIGDPRALGLDAAFPAGFVALLAPHLRSARGRAAAAGGAAIALVLVPLAPAGVPIIAAAAAVLPAAVLFREPATNSETGAGPAAGADAPGQRDDECDDERDGEGEAA